jgi:hypothetical protein
MKIVIGVDIGVTTNPGNKVEVTVCGAAKAKPEEWVWTCS